MELQELVVALLAVIVVLMVYQMFVKQGFGAQSRHNILKKMMGEKMAGNNIYAGTKYDMYQ